MLYDPVDALGSGQRRVVKADKKAEGNDEMRKN